MAANHPMRCRSSSVNPSSFAFAVVFIPFTPSLRHRLVGVPKRCDKKCAVGTVGFFRYFVVAVSHSNPLTPHRSAQKRDPVPLPFATHYSLLATRYSLPSSKGVGDVLKADDIALFVQVNGDQVKAHCFALPTFSGDKPFTRSAQSLLLARAQRFYRRPEFL